MEILFLSLVRHIVDDPWLDLLTRKVLHPVVDETHLVLVMTSLKSFIFYLK
jgi:hypothetical protein